MLKILSSTFKFKLTGNVRNNRGIARAPPGRLGATPWAAPERKEDNKSFDVYQGYSVRGLGGLIRLNLYP